MAEVGAPMQSHSALPGAEQVAIAVAAAATVCAGILHYGGGPSVPTFVIAALALALLAKLVGDGTEQIGEHLSPGVTGLLQALLGNLPELFIGIFALRAGLVNVVQAALIGSILGNSVLVLGLAFFVGGIRHGTQRFNPHAPRATATLLLLAVSALAIPTLAAQLRTPAAQHEEALSVVCACVLLAVFVGSTIFTLRSGGGELETQPAPAEQQASRWPLSLAIALLSGASLAAAFVSDWFVSALTPATDALGLAHGFTGLVVVALAGNAVENLVGVELMAKNRPDYAISVILTSSLQVALLLIPALVLISIPLGGAHLTLVLAPLLLGTLMLAALLGALIVSDGESTWLEGVALIGLYLIIAAGYWWG